MPDEPSPRARVPRRHERNNTQLSPRLFSWLAAFGDECVDAIARLGTVRKVV